MLILDISFPIIKLVSQIIISELQFALLIEGMVQSLSGEKIDSLTSFNGIKTREACMYHFYL